MEENTPGDAGAEEDDGKCGDTETERTASIQPRKTTRSDSRAMAMFRWSLARMMR